MNNDEKLTFMQQTSLATTLSAQDVMLMSHHANIIHLEQGEFIIQQGQKSNGMFILMDGSAIVTVKKLGSGSANLAKLKSGDFIGDIAVIDHAPYSSSVIAETSVTCIHIPNSYFDMLAYLFPQTKYILNSVLTNRLCEELKEQQAYILTLMQKIPITPQSMLGEVIKTFHKPDEISFSDMQLSLDYLLQRSFFKQFTRDELTALFSYCDLLHAPKLCTLIREGENETPCYIVLRGAVQNSVVQDNKFAKLSVLEPMTIFCGMMYIIPETRALFDYATCEQAILMRFSFSQMNMIKTSQPELWYKLFDIICVSFARLKKFADKLEIRLNSEFYNRW